MARLPRYYMPPLKKIYIFGYPNTFNHLVFVKCYDDTFNIIIWIPCLRVPVSGIWNRDTCNHCVTWLLHPKCTYTLSQHGCGAHLCCSADHKIILWGHENIALRWLFLKETTIFINEISPQTNANISVIYMYDSWSCVSISNVQCLYHV